MVKIPFVPRNVFVHSFFSPLRADPPGNPATDNGRAPIQPDKLSIACHCIRCKLTAIHGDLLHLAIDLTDEFDKGVVDAANAIFDIIRHDSGTCLMMVDLLQRIEAEAATSAGTLQGVRLRKIADDFKAYFERINK